MLLAVSAIESKIIFKDVSNIIEIGYNIAIVKEEYSWYTGSNSF